LRAARPAGPRRECRRPVGPLRRTRQGRGDNALTDRDVDHLRYLLESIELLEEWRRRGKEAFQEDPLLQAGAMYRMHTLAQSASMLSDEIKHRHPDVNWRGIRGFRNIVVHGYLRDVDLDLTWRFLEKDLDQIGAVAAAEMQRTD